MTQKKIKISEAKGRPMLSWVGKRPLTHVPAFPAQHIEAFDPTDGAWRERQDDQPWGDWPDRYPPGGLLFHGDNKEVLAHLLASGFRGKVKLIYIDPPFDSGADYVRRVQLRGAKGTAKIEGETYSLGEQIQYTDIWANDNYLQFMYERLLLLKELLAEDGSIYVHADYRRSHHFRLLLDEVFGESNFFGEIAWIFAPSLGSSKAIANKYGVQHHSIAVYGKQNQPFFAKERAYTDYSASYIKSKFTEDDDDGRGPYRLQVLATYSEQTYQELKADGRIVERETSKYPYYKQYLSESQGVPIGTTWEGIYGVAPAALEREEYPTQKPELLLERIIEISSNPGDIVLDCFAGSGTTAAVAQTRGRRWITADINKGAIQTTSKRVQAVIQEQIEMLDLDMEEPQRELDVASALADPPPAQLAFGVWRVNDYDLQIQHNEAVELACEHIGIERTRTDAFYDGVLGKRLAKVVPFNHPLSPLDLEAVKTELDARPEEDRDIVMVSLGKEPAADAWLEDWNALRKGASSANRIEVIELRTDPKYGKFLKHRPAEARVAVTRSDGKLRVEVEDFISPTILERLEMDVPLFRAKVEDWRAMVDCVMIDPSWDGDVFEVALSDVPERKDDLVRGQYELDAPEGETTVAVKVIDMLGEEVLVTRTV